MEVLGEEEARDGEHGHAGVLELGLTELVHLLLVGAGSEAERVEALRERLCEERMGAGERMFQCLAVATILRPAEIPTEPSWKTRVPWSRQHRRAAR